VPTPAFFRCEGCPLEYAAHGDGRASAVSETFIAASFRSLTAVLEVLRTPCAGIQPMPEAFLCTAELMMKRSSETPPRLPIINDVDWYLCQDFLDVAGLEF
jgi:hypothetical protein